MVVRGSRPAATNPATGSATTRRKDYFHERQDEIAREGDKQHNTIGRRRAIYVRVTENELARIRSRARARRGMSISASRGRDCLATPRPVPSLDIDIAELRKAFADLEARRVELEPMRSRAQYPSGQTGTPPPTPDRAVRRVSAAADNICALISAARS